MSKYLVKILSICAFVIILPLAILATALCVTESSSYKIRLYVSGENTENAALSQKVFINGKEVDELVVVKGSEVIISFEGVGYDFEGWYNGTDKSLDTTEANRISDKATYSFKANSSASITAKIKMKEYDVTYSGNRQAPDNFGWETTHYIYGADLKTKADVNNESFVCWNLEGTATPYDKATFPTSGAVKVVAAWGDQKEINYYYGTKLIFSERKFEDEFETYKLYDENSAIVTGNLPEDHKFLGWYDQALENEIDLDEIRSAAFDASTPLNVYMKVERIRFLTVSYYDGNVLLEKLNRANAEQFSSFTLWTENNEKVQARLNDAQGLAIYKFLGWKDSLEPDANEINATTIQTINQDFNKYSDDHNGELKIYLNKQEIPRITITIYAPNGSTVIRTTKSYTAEEFNSFALPEESEYKSFITYGYKFSKWINADDNSEINLEAIKQNFVKKTLNIKLQEVAIEFTLNVKFHAKSEETAVIKYSKATGFAPYNKERKYYTLVGFKLGNTVYNYNNNEYTSDAGEKLSNKLIDDSNTTVELTAVWKADYASLEAIIDATYGDTSGDGSTLYGFNGETYEKVSDGTSTNYTFGDEERGRDINSSLYDLFIGIYEKFATSKTGDKEVTKLSKVRIYYDESSDQNQFIDLEWSEEKIKELTFADIIDELLKNGTNVETAQVKIIFMFESPEA